MLELPEMYGLARPLAEGDLMSWPRNNHASLRHSSHSFVAE